MDNEVEQTKTDQDDTILSDLRGLHATLQAATEGVASAITRLEGVATYLQQHNEALARDITATDAHAELMRDHIDQSATLLQNKNTEEAASKIKSIGDARVSLKAAIADLKGGA